MSTVREPGLAPLLAAWRALAQQGLVKLHEISVGDPSRLLVYAEVNPQAQQKVLIAAGVHGDEPVAPWSLYSIVRDGLLDPQYGYCLWVCTNPSGYELGTRHNCDGFDINRSYTEIGLTPEAQAIVATTRGQHYLLAIDLHEDFESEGFYLYEPCVRAQTPYGRRILDEVLEAGFALQALEASFDLGYPPDEIAALCTFEAGWVKPDYERESRYFSAGLPMTMYLLQHTARRSLTFETPLCATWDERLAMHRIAVVAALAQIARVEGLAEHG